MQAPAVESASERFGALPTHMKWAVHGVLSAAGLVFLDSGRGLATAGADAQMCFWGTGDEEPHSYQVLPRSLLHRWLCSVAVSSSATLILEFEFNWNV